ncbi:FadR/GntR family transcriptional regulator [Oceaniglobus indicus]|uniref:FadR/GntR family transcriptional regulator n=1 Tax=Oceaniglobus indicus TaxID=2047749 RepID=UPI000C1A8A72|nr:FCD domain-containing protein [Oceaniglobus indicus]
MVQTNAQDLAGQTGLIGSVSRSTVRDVIAGKLAALIASGVLSVGDELPGERELASALSVSRETVRGAVQILAAHGILKVAHGARTTVAKSDLGGFAVQTAHARAVQSYDLESVHAARLLVERQVVRDAAREIGERTLGQLRRSLKAQADCLDDPVRFLLCDREFHLLIYRACGNPLLADMATDLYNYLLEYRRRIVARAGSIQASIADHHDIFAALEAHDEEAAAIAFGHHEMRIYKTTKAFLAADKPGATA